MSVGIVVWLDSGANHASCHKQTLTWDEVGCTEKQWDRMSKKKRESIAMEIAFGYSDWGFEKQVAQP